MISIAKKRAVHTLRRMNMSEVYTRVPTLDEQLTELIKAKVKNKPSIKVDVDENGHILVDKDKDPALYDLAVNG